jgi:hypothetical protein
MWVPPLTSIDLSKRVVETCVSPRAWAPSTQPIPNQRLVVTNSTIRQPSYDPCSTPQPTRRPKSSSHAKVVPTPIVPTWMLCTPSTRAGPHPSRRGPAETHQYPRVQPPRVQKRKSQNLRRVWKEAVQPRQRLATPLRGFPRTDSLSRHGIGPGWASWCRR